MVCVTFYTRDESEMHRKHLKDKDINELLDLCNKDKEKFFVREFPHLERLKQRSLKERFCDWLLGAKPIKVNTYSLYWRMDEFQVQELMLTQSLFSATTKQDVINYLNGYLGGRDE